MNRDENIERSGASAESNSLSEFAQPLLQNTTVANARAGEESEKHGTETPQPWADRSMRDENRAGEESAETAVQRLRAAVALEEATLAVRRINLLTQQATLAALHAQRAALQAQRAHIALQQAVERQRQQEGQTLAIDGCTTEEIERHTEIQLVVDKNNSLEASETINNVEGDVCTVCLEEVLPGQRVRLLRCGHSCFHIQCIEA